MLYGMLVTFFIFNSFLLVLLILIQQGKGNMGLGNLGGGAQMLFGGSGGQDIFQKITWILGAIFMAGSLLLAVMKSSQLETYTRSVRPLTTQSAPAVPGTSQE
ncbi:MAG: preprotein translocase subunit SecG [Candidatus Dependentiae bacterium]